MKSQEKNLAIAILAMCATLVLVAAVAYQSMSRSVDASRQVRHTYEVLTQMRATLAMLRDAENGARGYVITGDAAHLKPFEGALSLADRRIAHLKRLTAGNASQQDRLTIAERLISDKLALIDDIIDARTRRGFEAARREVATNRGEPQMARLRRLIRDMAAEENRLLQRRVIDAELSTRRAVIAAVIALPLIILLLVLTLLYTRKYFASSTVREAALRELAMQDELTRLFNRREMNNRLKEETARWRRYRHPLSLIMLDIDRFKAINDTYGHQVGDEVLQWVAGHLRTAVRSTDVAARFGGEEFTVILPETSLEDACAMAERIRHEVAVRPFRSPSRVEPPLEIAITLSAGVAGLDGDEDAGDPETFLISAADWALYEAKRAGRNRTLSQRHAPGPQLPLTLPT